VDFLVAYEYDENGRKRRIYTVNFDIVDAGSESKAKKLLIQNILNETIVDVTLFTTDSDVEIIPNHFDEIAGGETREITLVWKPKLTRETPLSVEIVAKAKIIKRAK